MLANAFGRLAFVVLCMLAWPIVGVSSAAASEACGVPKSGGDWPVGTQSRAGLDPQRLCKLVDQIAALDANIHSVLIVRGGKLVFEQYWPGYDQKWTIGLVSTAQGPDILHDVRSVSKSVTSLLMGIALDRKLVEGLDRPVFDFFPEYAAARTPAKDRILLRHLVSMSSGIEWNERLPITSGSNSEVIMFLMPQPYRYVLDQELATAPGKSFNYSAGDVALIGAIIQKATGKTLQEFARDVLFTPLGISEVEWATLTNGDVSAASGLRMRSRDMAKLGLLVLGGGMWNGKAIVSADWLRESAQPRFPNEYGHTGYLWWLGSHPAGAKAVESVEAYGLGGQRIVVFPELDMVVVVTAGRYNIPDGGKVTQTLLDDFLLPAAVRK